jgi:predicted membrane protein
LVKKAKTMNNNNYPHRRGKVVAGLIVVAIGFLLLLKQMNLWFFPGWLFSWPLVLIVVGLVIGAQTNFRNFGWTIPVLIGTFFLLDRMYPMFYFRPFFWPLLIIIIGLYLIFGRGRHWKDRSSRWENEGYGPTTTPPAYRPPTSSFYAPEPAPYVSDTEAFTPPATPPPVSGPENPEFIKTVAILGGVKKTVFSKNVYGGDIVTFMGGTEINLTQADIQGQVEFEVTQIFGGTKLIVPSHWDISTEMVALLGGIEDKRSHNPHINKSKLLVIKGTSIMGGIEIHSYV